MMNLGMNTDKLSGIVVYTIHDDNLRNKFREALIDINAEYLDDSTYGVPIQGMLRNDTIEKLKCVCGKAEKDTDGIFGKDDFVTLYWPTYKKESGEERYIKQTRII
jgi:hypothetical protein